MIYSLFGYIYITNKSETNLRIYTYFRVALRKFVSGIR